LAQRQARDTRQIIEIAVLVFSLLQDHYAIELKHLAEILPFKDCTPVPKTHQAIRGVIDLRGEIRCVMDLAQLLEPERRQHMKNRQTNDNKGYILIMKKNQVGLKIAQIQRILFVDEKQVEKAADEKSDDRYANRKGVLTGNIILLDVDNILAHPLFTFNAQQTTQ
jgi:purine-binding chemotaxis protein CheW